MSVRCHMPPSGCNNDTITGMLYGNPIYETHVKLGDTYCIVFDEPGIVSYIPDPENPVGFSPELPTGPFKMGCLPTVFTAVQEGTAVIFFTSFLTFKTEIGLIKVCEDYGVGEGECPCT